MTRTTLAIILALAVAAILCALVYVTPAGAAWRDTDHCRAPVRGYAAGALITGTVRYVGDGDSICVGPSNDPAQLIEIRLADWFAPELYSPGGPSAKSATVAAAMGKSAVCVVQKGLSGRTYSYDRVVATCMINGEYLSDLLRRSGQKQGGRGYR